MTVQPKEKSGYEMRVEKNVYVPMRDGVRLTLDVYRPDGPGRFPALLAISTYGKETQFLPIPSVPDRGTAPWDGNLEAGTALPSWIAGISMSLPIAEGRAIPKEKVWG